MLRHKFHAKRCEADGKKFASQKERSYYHQLKLQQTAGDVLFFLRQVPLEIAGGVKYVADYLVFYSDGHAEFIDVKGMRTQTYIAKKKMVEDLYPIEIIEK
jgi:hypothetical protein